MHLIMHSIWLLNGLVRRKMMDTVFYHQVVSHGIQMLNFCWSLYQMPPFFAHLFNPCSVWMVPQVKWLFVILFLTFSACCKTLVSWLRKILLSISMIPFCVMKVPAMFLGKLCLAVYTVPRMSALSPTLLGSYLFLFSNGLIKLLWQEMTDFLWSLICLRLQYLRNRFVEHSKLGDIMVSFQSERTLPHKTKGRN